MSHGLFGLAFLALTLSAPPPQLFSSALLPPPPFESRQNTYRFWFEALGLPSEEVEIVAAGFARAAEGAERLAAAARREEADLLLRMVVGSAVMNFEAQAGAGVATTEPAGIEGRERAGPTIEVRLSLVDILDGSMLVERSFDCQLPLTVGRFIAGSCLRTNFRRIVERMEEWAEREAAAREMIGDFGPTEEDRRLLGPAELARAYYREGVRASLAGFEERALDLMAEAQPLFKEAGMRRDERAAWEHLAYLMAVTHRGPDRAIDYAEQTVRIARELSDPAAEVRALNLLAACEARIGNYTRAAQIARSAAGQARARSDTLSEGTSIAILAGLAAVKGNFDQARALQTEALTLVRESGNARAEARVLLSIAAATAQDDGPSHSASLAQLEEVRERVRELGNLALLRDVTLVTADTRLATTDLALGLKGEVDVLRALKLANRLNDTIGEAAAIGLMGSFAMRLAKPSMAMDYLVLAHDRAREAGFVEGWTDSIQALAEITLDLEQGVALLKEVAKARADEEDLRGQIKTLSDLSRLQSGLERTDEAWESYRSAVASVEEYVRRLRENPDREDVRASFITVIKSLITTETYIPYLARYLRMNHMIPMPNPNWVEQ